MTASTNFCVASLAACAACFARRAALAAVLRTLLVSAIFPTAVVAVFGADAWRGCGFLRVVTLKR